MLHFAILPAIVLSSCFIALYIAQFYAPSRKLPVLPPPRPLKPTLVTKRRPSRRSLSVRFVGNNHPGDPPPPSVFLQQQREKFALGLAHAAHSRFRKNCVVLQRSHMVAPTITDCSSQEPPRHPHLLYPRPQPLSRTLSSPARLQHTNTETHHSPSKRILLARSRSYPGRREYEVGAGVGRPQRQMHPTARPKEEPKKESKLLDPEIYTPCGHPRFITYNTQSPAAVAAIEDEWRVLAEILDRPGMKRKRRSWFAKALKRKD